MRLAAEQLREVAQGASPGHAPTRIVKLRSSDVYLPVWSNQRRCSAANRTGTINERLHPAALSNPVRLCHYDVIKARTGWGRKMAAVFVVVSCRARHAMIGLPQKTQRRTKSQAQQQLETAKTHDRNSLCLLVFFVAICCSFCPNIFLPILLMQSEFSRIRLQRSSEQ